MESILMLNANTTNTLIIDASVPFGHDRTALKTGGKEILREKIFHQTDAASRSVSQSQLGAAVELLHFSSLLYGALL